MPSSAASAEPPVVPGNRWTARLLALSVLLFALWTLSCHITVLLKGTGEDVLRLFGAALLLLIGTGLAAFRVPRLSRMLVRVDRDLCVALPSLAAAPAPLGLKALALCAVLAILGPWALAPEPFRIWLCCTLLIVVAVIWTVLRSAGAPLQEQVAHGESSYTAWALPVLSLISGYLAMCVSRSNTDDAFYVNVAVALADSPELPIYLRDTIHGDSSALYAPYRVHSYELLAGALSMLTGKEALWVMHIALPGFTGAMLPLAWALLLRELDPRRWFPMLLLVVGWFLLDGDSFFSPSMHGYGRLFQGKAVMYSVGVPLLAALGLRLGRAPTATTFAVLLLAQVSMVGLSSTGLWLGPIVAVTALFSTLRWSRDFLKAAALGVASCSYTLAVGLWVRDALGASMAKIAKSVAAASHAGDPANLQRLEAAFNVGLAGWHEAYLYSAVLLLSSLLARTPLMRRYLLAFLLVFLLFFANPYLTNFVASSVVGAATFKRVLWFLPIGVSLGALFTAGWGPPLTGVRSAVALAVGVLLYGALFQHIAQQSVIRHARMRTTPSLKVNRGGLEAARLTAAAMPERGYVLATTAVALSLPMVHRHPYPIIVKPKWLAKMGPGRHRLRRSVDRKSNNPMEGRRRKRYGERLAKLKVSGMVLTHAAMQSPGMADALRELGFRRRHRLAKFQIWTRPDATVGAAVSQPKK